LQTVVFHADLFAFDISGAVAALVDQHSQNLAAANCSQIAHSGFMRDSLRACLSGLGRKR
jgi:hypothetical protein